ncbi:thioredoxin family protein [Constantimarinum furrinae]|uniref:Thioredoxin family protein n=1 Tax=Constantimarinum furrinae TaxID=2562285 RepID=A0A7G8PUE6_9FLAO|nr:thioredoxin family protein [Constantimarinum furrinae]QNJ97962.1 Putative thioredoxin family protein [Constantimarinum furrinae]
MKLFKLTLLLLSVTVTLGFSQPFNSEFQAETKSPLLLGKINKEGLSENSYADWFQKNYDEYSPDQQIIDALKNELKSYTITAFMGTWCGDSKREIPRFYKILEAADFPLERLTLIAVDKERTAYKQSPGGEEEGLNIHRVPTFIFFSKGKEINRIIESPVVSLEQDIANILTDNYTSNYYGVTVVDKALQFSEKNKYTKKLKKLKPQLQEKLTSMYELNTYANVLFFSGETEKAIAVSRLNTEFFPLEPLTYSSLAAKLGKTGQIKKALKNYEKALEMDPENSEIKIAIETLKSQI